MSHAADISANAGDILPGQGPAYLCIDLKSFYASVECAARGLDPFTTNLVVADPDRTEKTICLAITPAMKALGVRNRCRVFEIPPGIHYIMAKPRMQRYMEVSAEIYQVYLRFISARDIHVYSIDECFIDAAPYLKLYGMTARQLANHLMDAVFEATGICATAGIGTNLFLAKVALDVTAKHVPDHIGFLDQAAFEQQIWHHRPITDIWNIGFGIAKRLAGYGVYDLKGVCDLQESTLYREFGVNAEYLIDHAHGYEPCTIADIQAYRPEGSSISNGQVLPTDYTWSEARMVLREMTDALVLDLVDKELVAQSVHLGVGYSRQQRAGGAGSGQDGAGQGSSGRGSNGQGSAMQGSSGGGGPFAKQYDEADVYTDDHGTHYRGWSRGQMTGGSRKLTGGTDSRRKLMDAMLELYDQTTRQDVPVRRINIGFGDLVSREFIVYDLFTDVEAEERERDLQKAILAVKDKFGKNSLLMGTSLQDKATAQERNNQVGGHNAG